MSFYTGGLGGAAARATGRYAPSPGVLPNHGPLIDYVRQHYSAANVPGVYAKLKANGFTPPTAAVPQAAPAQPAAQQPQYTPGALDPQGVTDMTNLDYWRNGLLGANGLPGSVDAQYATDVAGQVAARDQQLANYQQQQLQTDEVHGSQGSYRSGLRDYDQGQNNAQNVAIVGSQQPDGTWKGGQIGRALATLANNYQRQRDDTVGQYNVNAAAIKQAAYNRMRGNYGT